MAIPYSFYPLGANLTSLPAGTYLEYIESNGTQYINTEVVITKNMGFQTEFSKVTSAYSLSLMGAQANSRALKLSLASYAGGQGAALLYAYTNSSISYFYVGSWWTSIFPMTWTIRSLISEIYINGNSISIYGSGSPTDKNYYRDTDINLPFFIGATNIEGTASFGTSASEGLQIRYSYVELYDEDELIADFRPYQLASGEVGMINTMTNNFHPNQGTGGFIAGPAL